MRVEFGLGDLDGLGKISRPQVVRFERIMHGRTSGPVEASSCLLCENDDTVVLMDVQMCGPFRFERPLHSGERINMLIE